MCCRSTSDSQPFQAARSPSAESTLGLPHTLFSPNLEHTGLSREIQTLLTLTLTKDFYLRPPTGKDLLLEQPCRHGEVIAPQPSLAVSALAAEHRHKPSVKTTFPH